MSDYEQASPETIKRLEAAIDQIVAEKPLWFEGEQAYVIAHLNRMSGLWFIGVYSQNCEVYNPKQLYQSTRHPIEYYWWDVKVNGAEVDKILIIQGLAVGPMSVAVEHVGDAVYDPIHDSVNTHSFLER